MVGDPPAEHEVFVANEQTDRPIDVARWQRLAASVLEAEGAESELSLVFVDEPTISRLNRTFLGTDSPTDVLAFPMDDEAAAGRSPDSGGTGPGSVQPDDMPQLLGDVVICAEQAWRNAPEHAGSFDDEVALLVVHGILHLVGMDHEDPEQAGAMESRERELLSRFHCSG